MEEFAPGRVGFLTQAVRPELLCSWVKTGREIAQRETGLYFWVLLIILHTQIAKHNQALANPHGPIHLHSTTGFTDDMC